MQALQGQRARQIHRHCGALSHAEPALESCFSSRRKGLLCRQFRLRRSLATRAHRMARRSNRGGGRNRFYHRCKIHRHCGTLGLPAAPTVRSGRGRLPGDFGSRAFCRGSLAPPARGPEGPGRWRCEDRGPWQAGRRAQARGAGRRPGAQGPWPAGHSTVARRTQGRRPRGAGPGRRARGTVARRQQDRGPQATVQGRRTPR